MHDQIAVTMTTEKWMHGLTIIIFIYQEVYTQNYVCHYHVYKLLLTLTSHNTILSKPQIIHTTYAISFNTPFSAKGCAHHPWVLCTTVHFAHNYSTILLEEVL